MIRVTRPFNGRMKVLDRKPKVNDAGVAEPGPDGKPAYDYGEIYLDASYSPQQTGISDDPILDKDQKPTGSVVKTPIFGKGKPFATQDEDYTVSQHPHILEKC